MRIHLKASNATLSRLKKAFISLLPNHCISSSKKSHCLDIRHDKIALIDGHGNVKLCLTDPTTSIKSSIHNIDAHLQKITLSHLNTRTNRLHPRPVVKTLEVGDRVVRGPDWCHGYEDGGRGGLGTVVKLTSWNTAGQDVLVKWDACLSISR